MLMPRVVRYVVFPPIRVGARYSQAAAIKTTNAAESRRVRSGTGFTVALHFHCPADEAGGSAAALPPEPIALSGSRLYESVGCVGLML